MRVKISIEGWLGLSFFVLLAAFCWCCLTSA